MRGGGEGTHKVHATLGLWNRRTAAMSVDMESKFWRRWQPLPVHATLTIHVQTSQVLYCSMVTSRGSREENLDKRNAGTAAICGTEHTKGQI